MTENIFDWIKKVPGSKPPDYMARVGMKYYKWPDEYVDECRKAGISRRVPMDLGKDIVPMVSRMIFVHARAEALVKKAGMSLADLALELHTEQMSEIGQSPDMDTFDPIALDLIDGESGRSRARLIRLLHWADDQKRLKGLQEKYELKFCEGFFMWGPLTGKHYIVPSENVSMNSLMGALNAGAELVQDVYID